MTDYKARCERLEEVLRDVDLEKLEAAADILEDGGWSYSEVIRDTISIARTALLPETGKGDDQATELLRKVLKTHDARGDMVAVANEIDHFLDRLLRGQTA